MFKRIVSNPRVISQIRSAHSASGGPAPPDSGKWWKYTLGIFGLYVGFDTFVEHYKSKGEANPITSFIEQFARNPEIDVNILVDYDKKKQMLAEYRILAREENLEKPPPQNFRRFYYEHIPFANSPVYKGVDMSECEKYAVLRK
ncbi:hypothetical protein BB560_007001 [Smittium megazygosporum]|uniref:Uncharacterized protein n=1 Tax=Smittium megazygosporum TaxID=133381 RepID=A0A2T9XZK3_9FUNG|nr:hypothetical protein BB560_007001 [Smittium megazygosporum]